MAERPPLPPDANVSQQDGQQTGTATSRPLRENILRASTALFAARGYRGTTIRAVVEAVGCTKPALYYYFSSKEALFLEAVRRPLVEFGVLVRETTASADPFPLRLHRFIETALSRAADDPAATRLILSLPHRPEEGRATGALETLYTGPSALLRELVDDAQRRGELRPALDPDVLASAIGALVSHNVFLLAVTGASPPQGTAQRIADLLLHGAAP